MGGSTFIRTLSSAFIAYAVGSYAKEVFETRRLQDEAYELEHRIQSLEEELMAQRAQRAAMRMEAGAAGLFPEDENAEGAEASAEQPLDFERYNRRDYYGDRDYGYSRRRGYGRSYGQEPFDFDLEYKLRERLKRSGFSREDLWGDR